MLIQSLLNLPSQKKYLPIFCEGGDKLEKFKGSNHSSVNHSHFLKPFISPNPKLLLMVTYKNVKMYRMIKILKRL
jgi:hypothetical protein